MRRTPRDFASAAATKPAIVIIARIYGATAANLQTDGVRWRPAETFGRSRRAALTSIPSEGALRRPEPHRHRLRPRNEVRRQPFRLRRQRQIVHARQYFEQDRVDLDAGDVLAEAAMR